MAKIKDPLKRVFPWEWGPSNGVGIIKNNGAYILINAPEPNNATEEYLYQYGFPRSKEAETIDAGYDLGQLIYQAQSRDEIERPSDLIGDKDVRKMANNAGLNKYQASLAKFWMTITGNAEIPQLDSPDDLLDEFTDDAIFQKAANEIAHESPQFIWQCFLSMPPAARLRALWRVATINSPAKPGAFGVDSRTALIVKMYLVASGGAKPSRKILNSDPHKLMDYIVSNNDRFEKVVNRIVKVMGYNQAVLYLFSDIQRIKLVRSYLRRYGSGWVDQPYF